MTSVRRQSCRMLLAGLIACFSARLLSSATPSISLTVSTVAISSGVTTSITATARVIGGTPAPGAVDLLQVDPSNGSAQVIAVMAQSSDGMFSTTVPFSPTAVGQIDLQASAAFKGMLLRVKSAVTTIPVFDGSTCPVPWLNAPTVYGTIYFHGSGTGANDDVTETTNQNFALGLQLASTGGCVWGAGLGLGAMIDAGSIDDTSSVPTCVDTVTGNGPGPFHSASLGILDGQYSFLAIGLVNGVVTTCDGTTISELIPWGPPIIAGNSPPVLFTLPSEGPLSGQTTFSEVPLDSGQGISKTWDVHWRFSPVPDDSPSKPCTDARGSKVGCQSQTLGESIPIKGTPFWLNYSSERAPGRAGGDVVATADARRLGGWTITVHHVMEPLFPSYCVGGACSAYSLIPKALFLGDGTTRSDADIQAAPQSKGNIYLTSQDGSEVYLFSAADGVHRETRLPLTGALLYSFAYDTKQRLISISDANGNVTVIRRDDAGSPTAIVSPYGLVNTLQLDINGFLKSVTDPEGNSWTLSNSTAGLLTGLTDPNGNFYQFQYDTFGRLIRDSDPAGGSLNLVRSDIASGYRVAKTTALGKTTTYDTVLNAVAGASTSENSTVTASNDLQSSQSISQELGLITDKRTLPDGSTQTSSSQPDPRWGLQVPMLVSTTDAMGGLLINRSFARKAALADAGDPFSLTSQADEGTINGRSYMSSFVTAGRTLTRRSPAGRELATTLDEQERPSAIQFGGILPIRLAYDGRGRLASWTQGTRSTTFSYDSAGNLSSVANPLGFSDKLAYDAVGRLLTRTLADARSVAFAYDPNGNMLSITTPNETTHAFSYSKVNLLASHASADANETTTRFTYNADHQLSSVMRPDSTIIAYAYDSAGRLSSVVTPTGTRSRTYDSKTGHLTTLAIVGGESLSYQYQGPFRVGSTWTGRVAGSVTRILDSNLWTTAFSVGGGSSVAYKHDDDGLVTAAGALSIVRSDQNSTITGASLGAVADSRTYNDYGELSTFSASVKGVTLYEFQLVRDNLGRIASKTETIQGVGSSSSYGYDATGRLNSVNSISAKTTYVYDANSNRVKIINPSGTIESSYDADDQMLTRGSSSYTYTPNGEVLARDTAGQHTAYRYDAMGNLLSVALPSGATISYVVDGRNRRVGRMVNGSLVSGFLYDGDKVVAQLDSLGNVINQFVYGTTGKSPDFMIRSGVTYRILTDQLGSPRLVVDTVSGAVIDRIDYDQFGNITNDTNPGFQPFGFAAGFYDVDTKLLRFGARDYDPSTGRWTAPDPSGFAGREHNLYNYAMSDPINFSDHSGYEPTDGGSDSPQGDSSATGGANAENGSESSETIDKIVEVVEIAGPKIIEATNELTHSPEPPEPGEVQTPEITPPRPSEEYVEVTKGVTYQSWDALVHFFETLKSQWNKCSSALGGNTGTSAGEPGTSSDNSSENSTPHRRPTIQVWQNK